MKHRIAAWSSLSLLACALGGCSPEAQATANAASPTGARLEITPAGSQPSTKGSAENFTGDVVIDPLFAANAHRRGAAASVRFAPGARTAWHSHPAGQTLIVTAGTGWVREWGGQKHEVKPGDVIWTPPRAKHWHGGTATETMTHIAIQEHVDGKVVDWMEQVSDEQYQR
ncbi:cupin domain-containing protein [Polyangium sp. 6x1]|nr:cupin domain-containing protein [Polyangium sp. 6x1]MDI1447466.1 cupin domain-containing protein [Polyangium sp. 6x1]